MKKLIGAWLLLGTLLLSGCGGDEKIAYVTDDELLARNGITDVVLLYQKGSVEGEMTVYYANRKGKDWIALFDRSGALLDEWYGQDRECPKTEDSILWGSSIFGDLGDGNYVFLLLNGYDKLKQIVFLQADGTVKYGFFPDEKGFEYLTVMKGKGFFGRKSGENTLFICDFDGNVLVEDIVQNSFEEERVWYSGFQGDKAWVGHYDEEGNFQEAVGEEPFKRNRKYHVGYGEYEEFNVEVFSIDDPLKTDWGYAFLPKYGGNNQTYSYDVFVINEGRLIDVMLADEYPYTLYNWYEKSILVCGKYVVSPEGEVIAEFKRKVETGAEPLSYTETIGCYKAGYYNKAMIRYDHTDGEQLWFSPIEKLIDIPTDSHITVTLVEKKDPLWRYRCEVVNQDGSKINFTFDLHVETGEITYTD